MSAENKKTDHAKNDAPASNVASSAPEHGERSGTESGLFTWSDTEPGPFTWSECGEELEQSILAEYAPLIAKIKECQFLDNVSKNGQEDPNDENTILGMSCHISAIKVFSKRVGISKDVLGPLIRELYSKDDPKSAFNRLDDMGAFCRSIVSLAPYCETDEDKIICVLHLYAKMQRARGVPEDNFRGLNSDQIAHLITWFPDEEEMAILKGMKATKEKDVAGGSTANSTGSIPTTAASAPQPGNTAIAGATGATSGTAASAAP